MKKTKLILLIIFIGAIGYLLMGWFIGLYKNNYCTEHRKNYKLILHPIVNNHEEYTFDDKYEYNRNELLYVWIPTDIVGLVFNKFIDSCEHHVKCVDFSVKNYYLPMTVSTLLDVNSQYFFDEIKIGDSVFKNKGSLTFSIKRGKQIKNYNLSPMKEYWIKPYYLPNTDTLK